MEIIDDIDFAEKKPRKTFNLGSFIKLLLVVAVIAVIAMVHQIPENRFAVRKQFAKIVEIRDTSGIMIVPFWQQLQLLPKNSSIYDLDTSEVLTKDTKPMIVDSYCTWQIDDPMKYIQTLNGIDRANRRLDATIYSSIKNTLSAMTQQEIFTEREGIIDEMITESVAAQMGSYGIKVLDVQLKQFSLPDSNQQAVYARMISERNRIAKQLIAEGKENANKVKNQADKEVKEILADSEKQAAKLRAEGESEYMKILSEAYAGAERAEFYEFLRTMDSLKVVMKGEKTVVLPYDSPIAKWFLSYGGGQVGAANNTTE